MDKSQYEILSELFKYPTKNTPELYAYLEKKIEILMEIKNERDRFQDSNSKMRDFCIKCQNKSTDIKDDIIPCNNNDCKFFYMREDLFNKLQKFTNKMEQLSKYDLDW